MNSGESEHIIREENVKGLSRKRGWLLWSLLGLISVALLFADFVYIYGLYAAWRGGRLGWKDHESRQLVRGGMAIASFNWKLYLAIYDKSKRWKVDDMTRAGDTQREL